MNKYITLLMIILFAHFSQAQNNNYSSLWKQVESFENEGLPKSALEIVESIEKKAKADKNSPQIVKTLFFKSKFALILEEDAQLQIINNFKTEIANSAFPTKNILESVLADLYWQYFQQNRYKFYNRTKTESKVDADDFRTWDLQTLFDEIHIHHQNALHSSLMLQQEELSQFDNILTLQEGSKIYRPTVFDFLSHNALAFYKTDENSITKPVYKFEIDNPDFLNDAERFSKLKIESKDSTSLQLNALKIYQELIKFHLKDVEPYALADVNIERLDFVENNATFNDKETVLLKTLKTESDNLKSHEVSGLYEFEIASILNRQGNSYQAETNEEHRWKIKEALAICKSVIFAFPKSKGAEKCAVLQHQIEQQTLQIQAEDYLPIQQHSRLLITYRNFTQLDFKIYKITAKQLEQFNTTYRQEEQLSFIKKLDVTTQWQSNLRNENDYQMHTTEVLFPKLDNGIYVVFASPNSEDDSVFAFKTIQITNLAVVTNDVTTKTTYQVIDRNNGKPIPDAKLKITYQKNYNGKTQTENLITDSNGETSIKKSALRYTRVKIEVTHNNEKAYFGDYYINQYYETSNQDKISYNSFLFTDRSIYRPGQMVYFKGIAMKTEGGKSQVLANQEVYAVLYNTNGEEIKELKLKTNEFGSVSGEFIIPNAGITGEFQMVFRCDKPYFKTYNYISVEEYKRPKFETKFNPITETFRVNDSITIKGEALAYAGSNITDAKVVYRVHRKVRYPDWYYWYRPAFQSAPQEIAHGESITNDKGEFEITFKAIPDESADKNSLPIFNYEITADVTDLNGETRSATTIVNVGYHALIANISIAVKLDKTTKDHKLTIDTKNLNGEFVPAKGTVKIYKLQAPNRVLRPRPWEAPDYQEFKETEFINLFPHEAYFNESDSNNWEKGALVLEEKFNTEKSKELELGNIKKWQSGQYIVILESKDKFGQLVKAEAKTTLFSDKDETLADNQLFNITTNKASYNANETVELTLASSAKNITVFIDVEKNHSIVDSFKVELNNDKKTITIPVTKSDVGGFAVHYSFAVYNSFQSGTEIINIPYPKTDLDIETNTFRDKLQPGQDETWSFKIKGPKGDKVSSELLASMYDASLDQFKPHTWEFNPINKPNYYSYSNRNAGESFGNNYFRVYNQRQSGFRFPNKTYDQLNWFGLSFGYGNGPIMIRGMASGINIQEDSEMIAAPMTVADESLDEVVVTGNNRIESKKALVFNSREEQGSGYITSKKEKINFDNVQIRKNLQETAFFFPQLQTDKEGNVSFSFTTPEALTQWKLQLLAHTKNLESATKTLTTVTQKELMVIPNAPRFLREGDQITISTKIANISGKALSGHAVLQLFDAVSGKDITEDLLKNKRLGVIINSERKFFIDRKGNTQVSWVLYIPDNVQAVQYKVIAKAGDFSDGEQNALPVLTNRMLVTETLPMWIRSNQTKTFTLDKLKDNTSTTLKNHKLTLEMTSNPAWYAVQALPYLMEYPYECNEQTFSRYYANALASHIANSNPRIQDVFNQWRNTDALLSNLEKNEELKSILIQETPWLRDAQSETEQKKRIALLFDLNKMNNELQSAKRKLEQNQMPNGAWAWFNGGHENRYITQHIITGFGHLKQLNVSLSAVEGSSSESMIQRAINYLDAEFVQEYKDIRKYDKDVNLSKDHLSYTQLHYLYMRSFYPEIKTSKEVEEITKYYHTQIQKYWLSRSLYAKGLMALVVDRMDDKTTSAKILKSLKENSITSEELGMYWKDNTNSWFWYQSPIETQALLIEAFSEIENDTDTIDNLKIWLLKNKQTNRWKTTKATTEAVYALLLQGSDWLSVTDMVDVVLGGQEISPSKLENVKVEAGTGYYKTAWNGSEITPEMADVKITKKGKGIAWGSLYWQYFEDLDKITSAETPLKLEKKLFLKTNTDTGEEISEITDATNLKVGDLVRVRIELRSDRNMEFIHMKDMRASGLEPVNVLSEYKWQDGLGYYESTKDASTNFFFDYLPKGVYVFEYDLRVNNAGNMSNGITTIQSMYAPEFSSHSEGIRVLVK